MKEFVDRSRGLKIPGVVKTPYVPFRPSDPVLREDILDGGRSGKTARYLSCSHSFSGRSAVTHMDQQYEGFHPDLMETPGANLEPAE